MKSAQLQMEKLPGPGWTRIHVPASTGIRGSTSGWTDGRATVISSLIDADAPDGSGDVIPQWHISVVKRGERPDRRVLRRALRAFGMADAEEDNHHPGNARHFFKPVDPARRVGCECKATESIQREPDGYTWTNPTEGPCRGCELVMVTGRPCRLHPGRLEEAKRIAITSPATIATVYGWLLNGATEEQIRAAWALGIDPLDLVALSSAGDPLPSRT